MLNEGYINRKRPFPFLRRRGWLKIHSNLAARIIEFEQGENPFPFTKQAHFCQTTPVLIFLFVRNVVFALPEDKIPLYKLEVHLHTKQLTEN